MRFPGGASPSQFDDSRTRKTKPEWFFPSHARVGTLGRVKRVARSHRAPARPRQSDDRELPSAGVRLLSFTLSLSVSYRKNEEVRFCVLRVRVLASILVSCTRVVEPDPFISFIPTAFFAPGYACPGVRARTSARTRHFRDAESEGWRRGCGTDANARGSIGLCETLMDGWMDPDPGGDRDCVRVMRRRRVRDRGDDGGCVVERSFFSSTRSEAMVYEVVLVFIDVRTKRG